MLASLIMHLGISLGSFHGFTFDEALDTYGRLAERFGLTAVEINFQIRPGPETHWPWDIPKERIRSFVADFRERGAHLPFFDLNPIAANHGIREESIRQLRLAIEASAEMKMTYVVIHARGSRLDTPWSEERDLWLGVFRELAELAAREGLVLCIENGDRLVRLDRLLSVVQSLGQDHVRICLDVGHAHQRLAENGSLSARLLPRLDERWKGAFRISRLMPFEPFGSLAGFLREAESRVHLVHLHDRRGGTDHLRLGEGAIDLHELAPFLRETRVILEIPTRSEQGLAQQIQLAENIMNGDGGRL